MRVSEQASRRRHSLVTGFTVAAAFLTRIPVAAPEDSTWPLARSAWAFPLVGAGIGAVAAFAFLTAQLVGLGDLVAALLAVMAGILLTGALHEDGLADTFDGLFGGGDRERRLAIMRDSRHGSFAVLALVMSVALRSAALARIGEPVFAGLALVAAHAGSRAMLPAAMWLLPPARGDGLGAGAGRPSFAGVAAAVLIALAIAAVGLGPLRGVVALVLATFAVAVMAAVVYRRIGGYTGDSLGALQQIAEIAGLLAAASA